MKIEIYAAYILIFNILMYKRQVQIYNLVSSGHVATCWFQLSSTCCNRYGGFLGGHVYFVVAQTLYRPLKQALPMISHCWPGVWAETFVLGPTHPVFLTRRCMRAGSMG